MKNSLFKTIQSLPPLPKSVLDVERVYQDPESSIADMVKVLEHDPMIVANLLKAANSPLYSFQKEINSVFQAVSLFGMSMTRSIVLANSVRKLLNIDMEPYATTSAEFADIATKRAALVQCWYKKIDSQKADKLFLAALLQESGKILIANEIIQEDLSTQFRSEIEMSVDIESIEQSYVEVTSVEVSAAIFEAWEFDKEFVEMIRFSSDPAAAPKEIEEYASALHVIKNILPMHKVFSQNAIDATLELISDAEQKEKLVECLRKLEIVDN